MAGESCPQTLGVVVRFGRVIPRTDQHAPDRPGGLALGRGSRATRPFPGHGGHEPRRSGGAAPAPGLAPARGASGVARAARPGVTLVATVDLRRRFGLRHLEPRTENEPLARQ
jgi:hypothetical protein